MKMVCFLLLLSIPLFARGQGEDDLISVPSKLKRNKLYTFSLAAAGPLDSAKVYLIQEGIVNEFTNYKLSQSKFEVTLPVGAKAGSKCRLEIRKKDGKVLVSNSFKVKRKIPLAWKIVPVPAIVLTIILLEPAPQHIAY